MKPLVVDASAVCELLLLRPAAQGVARAVRHRQLFAPQLLTVEVLSVLRGWLQSGQISETRADEALADYMDMPIDLVDLKPLVAGAWRLRHNISAYDAMYVALARSLDTELLTCDRKLSRSIGSIALLP